MATKSSVVAKNKPKFSVRIKGFLRGVWAELKKVHWPTRKQLLNYTIIVLVTILAVGFILWVIDSILTLGIEGLLKLVGK